MFHALSWDSRRSKEDLTDRSLKEGKTWTIEVVGATKDGGDCLLRETAERRDVGMVPRFEVRPRFKDSRQNVSTVISGLYGQRIGICDRAR